MHGREICIVLMDTPALSKDLKVGSEPSSVAISNTWHGAKGDFTHLFRIRMFTVTKMKLVVVSRGALFGWPLLDSQSTATFIKRISQLTNKWNKEHSAGYINDCAQSVSVFCSVLVPYLVSVSLYLFCVWVCVSVWPYQYRNVITKRFTSSYNQVTASNELALRLLWMRVVYLEHSSVRYFVEIGVLIRKIYYSFFSQRLLIFSNERNTVHSHPKQLEMYWWWSSIFTFSRADYTLFCSEYFIISLS